MILSVFLFCGFLIFCPISGAIVENRPYAFDRFFRWMWGSFDRFVFNGNSTLLGFSRGLSELVIFHDSPIAPKCWFPQKNENKHKRETIKKKTLKKKFPFLIYVYLFVYVCGCFLFESSVESLFSSCFYFGSFCFSDVFYFYCSFFWFSFDYCLFFIVSLILEFCEELFFTSWGWGSHVGTLILSITVVRHNSQENDASIVPPSTH